MSDTPISKEMEELNRLIEKDIQLDRRKKDVAEKDLTLREHRVNRDLEELLLNQSEMEQAKSVSFGEMDAGAIAQLVAENEDYMEAAKHSMTFINKEFKAIVPFFRKNLIMICGDTGDGKSTSVANAAFSVISQKNPATGKSCRVLVLTNEEKPEDFYNRITCLVKGWKYANHDQFNDEQRKTFREFIPKLAENGRLTVIGDVYQGVPGFTTTIEGITTVFTNLLREMEITQQIPYDAIVIDYYQNFNSSKMNPKLNEYECQRRLANLLDQMKNRYPGPIVLMAQIKKLAGEDDTTPFNVRLKGSKLICDKCTFIVELIPERQLLRSKWTVWKSRFTEAVGQSIYTGYDRGKFVPYNSSFQQNVSKLVEKNLERAREQQLGMGSEEPETTNDPTESS